MEQFNVTGMSCAACSARVEKAVKSVPGVTGCSVSLLTNSMGVEGTAEDAAIIRAVEQAGYGASPKKSRRSGQHQRRAGCACRPRNTQAKAAAYRLAGLFAGTDVLFHGAHDVGLAATPLV